MIALLTKFFTGDKGQRRLMLIILVWLILNALLALTNHQQLTANNVMLAQNAAQCPKSPANAELPRYVRSQA